MNVVEIVANNIIQIKERRVRTVGGVVVSRNHRRTVSSESDLSAESLLVKSLALEFSFVESVIHADGVHEHVSFIRLNPDDLSVVFYKTTLHIVEGGNTVFSQRNPFVEVDCLEDATQHPGKVQQVAALVFTPEVKAAYIANLPTADVLVSGQTKTETVNILEKTEKQVVNGLLTDVVIQAARQETNEVPKTQEFINYKGSLYPSEWNGI